MSDAKITGLNHLTLAVSDLERSLEFYRDLLGCEVRALWAKGAYLQAGALWLCLSVDDAARPLARPDYTHYAFSVSPVHWGALTLKIREAAQIWKENTSEGQSLYFLDPDGHRLELHTGSLETRLAHYLNKPSSGVTVL